MPLSEHEQRMLDEMERNLYRHDADFVASVSRVKARPNYRLIVVGVLLALVGFGGIIAALSTHTAVVGVAGFVIVLAGVLIAMRTTQVPAETPPGRGAAASAARSRKSFMDRMNDRWDRRTS